MLCSVTIDYRVYSLPITFIPYLTYLLSFHISNEKKKYSYVQRNHKLHFNWNPQEICGHITNSLGKTTVTNTQKCTIGGISIIFFFLLCKNACQLIYVIFYTVSAVLQVFSLHLMCTILQYYLHVITHQYINACFSTSFALDTFSYVKRSHSHNTAKKQKKGQL